MAGLSKAGLYPFNPEKVLGEVYKPQVEEQATQLDGLGQNLSSLDALARSLVTVHDVALLRRRVEANVQGQDCPTRIGVEKLGKAAERAFAARRFSWVRMGFCLYKTTRRSVANQLGRLLWVRPKS